MNAFFCLLLGAFALSNAKHLNDKFGRGRFPFGNGRIVGGRDADITEFPHQASLQDEKWHICGASVISEKFIVTAAHCTEGKTAQQLFIRVNTSVAENFGKVFSVKQIHQNPKFNPIMENDISILELEESLQFSASVKPVTLPEPGTKIPAGTTVTVTGWGVLQFGGVFRPTQLQAVDVNIVDHEECVKDYNRSGERVTETMLCASVPEGGKDACQGDSGGPLVFDGVLYGIVSWGIECALADFPGVYTDVAAVRGFIKEVTGL